MSLGDLTASRRTPMYGAVSFYLVGESRVQQDVGTYMGGCSLQAQAHGSATHAAAQGPYFTGPAMVL
jgi:hypothetical protein